MGFGRGGFWVLLRDRTRRKPKGTTDEAQRVHVVRVEGQVATELRAVRNRRPIITGVADEAERTIIAAVTARSREIDSSSLTTIGPEIMTKVILINLKIACIINT